MRTIFHSPRDRSNREPINICMDFNKICNKSNELDNESLKKELLPILKRIDDLGMGRDLNQIISQVRRSVEGSRGSEFLQSLES